MILCYYRFMRRTHFQKFNRKMKKRYNVHKCQHRQGFVFFFFNNNINHKTIANNNCWSERSITFLGCLIIILKGRAFIFQRNAFVLHRRHNMIILCSIINPWIRYFFYYYFNLRRLWRVVTVVFWITRYMWSF